MKRMHVKRRNRKSDLIDMEDIQIEYTKHNQLNKGPHHS